MRILAANLMHLYQNREIWAWYVFLGICITTVLFAINDQLIRFENSAVFGPVLIFLFIIGTAMGRSVASVWNRPFSFCMPGQRESSQKMLLVIGVASSIIASFAMIILFHIKVRFLDILIILISYYLMVYWLSVLVAIRFNRMVFVIFFLVYLIVPGISRSGLLNTVQEMILKNPLASVCICVPASYLMYRTIGIRYLARSLCDVPWTDFFAGWEKSRSNRYRLESVRIMQRLYAVQFAEFLSIFFSRLIRSHNNSLLLQQFLGRAYIIFTYLLTDWWRIFVIGLYLLIWLHYMPGPVHVGNQIFFFYLLGLVGGQMCVIAGPGILLPLGRKERYFSGIITLIMAIFIIFILAAALIPVSKTLIRICPTFISAIWAHGLLLSLQVKYIFISIIVIPIIGGLFIIFQRKPFLSKAVFTAMVIGLFCIHSCLVYKGGYIFNMFNLFIIILLTVLSLGFYLIVLYDNMKSSLS